VQGGERSELSVRDDLDEGRESEDREDAPPTGPSHGAKVTDPGA